MRDICHIPMMCDLCQRSPGFRAEQGIMQCPQGLALTTAPTITTPPTSSPREAPTPPRETKVCKHRGEPDGTCNCGSAKFKCNLIGITVRGKQRPNHPADIACDVCPKKEF